MSRPTILLIIPNLDTGGAEQSTVEIAEAVVKAGGRAIVLTEGGRLTSRLVASGGEFIAFPASTKNPARIIWNAKKISDLCRREGVDLIDVGSRAPAWSVLIAARSTGLPFVTTYHGAYNEKTRIKKLYNSAMARSDIVIANSRYTAELIKSRYDVENDRLRIVYRGVDDDRFDPTKVSAGRIAALRQSWGVTPETRIVLHAARVTPLKGQRIVIDAAHRLRQQGQLENAIIIFAGSAQGRTGYVEELEARIANAELQQYVRLIGHLDDMPAGLAAADLALMVSTEPEGFGCVSAEAQAIGCPVIVTRIGALPETVVFAPRDKITGWVITPGKADELAEAIAVGLAVDPAERATIGRRAREHVLSSFTLSTMQAHTLEVYDELLGTSLKTRFLERLSNCSTVDLRAV